MNKIDEEKFERQDFDLFKALDAIDKKDYGYFSRLSDEQKKKFSGYMLLMWVSAVKSEKVAPYYLLSTEYHANKYFFNEKIQNHQELQWMMLCASSPGIGKQFHQYIPHINAKIAQYKIKAKVKDIKDYFLKIYKQANDIDINGISEIFVEEQNQKYRISNLCPNLKLEDIEVLSTLISKDELDQYDEYSGK